jgi:hypothetical protein
LREQRRPLGRTHCLGTPGVQHKSSGDGLSLLQGLVHRTLAEQTSLAQKGATGGYRRHEQQRGDEISALTQAVSHLRCHQGTQAQT